MTLHDVSFDGKSVFYRLSLSEMFVPYGDPRYPIYRKGAFDLGNVGAGVTANNLKCMFSPLSKFHSPQSLNMSDKLVHYSGL